MLSIIKMIYGVLKTILLQRLGTRYNAGLQPAFQSCLMKMH